MTVRQGLTILACLLLGACDLFAARDALPFRTFEAMSDAMQPTIAPGDVLLGFTFDPAELKRGDLVVTEYRQVNYLMRIAGLPGDRVALVNGQVILNGEEVALTPEGTVRVESDFGPREYQSYSEQFPGEAQPHLILDREMSFLDNHVEVVLPENRYFLLGDNRDNAVDSRMASGGTGPGLGLVSSAQITRKIELQQE